MIGSMSNFAEALVIDSVFGRIPSYNWPGTLYVALFTTLPDDSGANGTEVSTSGTGYSRLPISNNSTNFDATPTSTSGSAVKGVKKNKTAWVFPTSTSAWGEIRGAGIYDASSGGNLLWLFEWSQPRVVAANDTMRVEALECQFTFNQADASLDPNCVLSFALQRAFLDSFFGGSSAPVIPTDLYGALMTVIPGADESSAAGTELTLGTANYTRVQIPNDSTRFPAYSNGSKSNGQQIVWPQASASWSSVVAVCFYAGSGSGATLIAKLNPNTTFNWVAGDQPRIAAGALPIQAD
jgi:hypothetical protein